MTAQDIEKIEGRIDKVVAGAVPVDMKMGGIQITSMIEVFELAKLMAVSGTAVPKHLRGNPGACLAIAIQSLEWHMSPFAVANKSYEVNDRIAYESQLIHAVVEARAPLQKRLRKTYSGEGLKRKCKVIGHFKGETEAVEYDSPEFDKITPKNSPLWRSDPDQQLWYYSVRAWARANCPDVLMGIYGEDELEGIVADRARDITPSTEKPSIGARLKKDDAKSPGFGTDNVSRALEHNPGQVLDAALKKEPVLVQAETGQTQTLQQPLEETRQLALEVSVEDEMKSKIEAISRCHTKADLTDLVENVTSYLKDVVRTDLLPDFHGAVKKREKKLTV